MKSLKHVAAAALLTASTLLVPGIAKAQQADSVTGVPVDAVFAVGIAINQVQSLNFGTIIHDGTLGTATLTPVAGGAATIGGTGGYVSMSGQHQAEFDVFGPANQQYNLTLPASILLNCVSGCDAPGATVDVTTVNYATGFGTSGAGTGAAIANASQTSAAGSDSIAVGGTISWANDRTGTYAGTFDISVDY